MQFMSNNENKFIKIIESNKEKIIYTKYFKIYKIIISDKTKKKIIDNNKSIDFFNNSIFNTKYLCLKKLRSRKSILFQPKNWKLLFGEISVVKNNIIKISHLLSILNYDLLIDYYYVNNRRLLMEYLNIKSVKKDSDDETVWYNYENNPSTLNFEQHLIIFINLLLAVNYLHKIDLIHSDIKPSNIFYNKSFKLKLTDIDTAVLKGEETIAFTDKYRSIDSILGEKGSEKNDIWSIGVILFNIITNYNSKFPLYDEIVKLKKKEDYNNLFSKIIYNVENEIFGQQFDKFFVSEDKEVLKRIFNKIFSRNNNEYNNIETFIKDFTQLSIIQSYSTLVLKKTFNFYIEQELSKQESLINDVKMFNDSERLDNSIEKNDLSIITFIKALCCLFVLLLIFLGLNYLTYLFL